jgi:DNA-directed RNA polymerase subunit L
MNKIFTLTQKQKDELLKLLTLDNKGADDLFYNIEHVMKDNTLPPINADTGMYRKNVVVKDIAKKLEDISKTAKKLQNQLSRLNDFTIDHIDSSLGEILGTPYQLGTFNDGQPMMCTDDISSIKAAEIIKTESSNYAYQLVANFGNGYIEETIEALTVIYPIHLVGKIKVSNDSKFIHYIAIILEGVSIEGIYKQVLNSRWYKDKKK